MYAIAIPLNFRQYNIAHLEMVNVVVALKLFQLWAYKHIEIWCDNRAVVDVLSLGILSWPLVHGCVADVSPLQNYSGGLSCEG